MSVIEVEAPGMLTTVQDLGRDGFGPLGISPSGAADAVSLRIGNLIAGNDQDAPALEMTLLGGTYRFPQGCVFALGGSDFGATLDGAPVDPWTSVDARPGQTLRVGPTKSGARCYLCIQGGIATKPFLGSASTHLLSGLGGLEGRALRKGDVLKIGAARQRFRAQRLSAVVRGRLAERAVIRVTDGPQRNWFPEASLTSFFQNTFRIAEESNRLGIRLVGAAIPCPRGSDMITEGVSLGAVQVTPAGQPIILFVEQQTTGGYPKIANVISADLHRVGQLRPRDEVRFERVELDSARSLLAEQEKMLASAELIAP
jgi:biotin-dependent carboxylase-like uncharacterized protein